MKNIFYLPESVSTNDEIIEILPYGGTGFPAIYTFKQTKGKGQYGNSWESSENLNIAYSLAIESNKIKISESLFNFYTANILRDFLANLTTSEVKIKWPNDLIIKNKKISGMLTEKKSIKGLDYFILGIGLNVLQIKFENLPNAGSLLSQTGKSFVLKKIAEDLHQAFNNDLQSYKSEEQILNDYNEHLFRKDLVSVFEIKGNRQNGIIKSCDENGKILIEMEKDGLRKFFHKEIALLY